MKGFSGHGNESPLKQTSKKGVTTPKKKINVGNIANATASALAGTASTVAGVASIPIGALQTGIKYLKGKRGDELKGNNITSKAFKNAERHMDNASLNEKFNEGAPSHKKNKKK